MRRKKILMLLLLLCLTGLLTGCRSRTARRLEVTETQADGASELSGPEKEGSLPDDASLSSASGEVETEQDHQENEEPGSKTRENPDASRKEYDENAPAEIVPGTDHLLHGEGKGNGTPLKGDEADESASQLDDQADDAAKQTVAAQQAEQMGVDPDADAADSSLTYFTVLLSDRMGSLFECQRLNAYWETPLDHVTVFKTSLEHSLILNAGAYDVSARLLEENLKVDDGWVVRKNPGLIVKMVDGGVLGESVQTTNAAKAVLQTLIQRDGWSTIDAVRNGRVVLLSEELLHAPFLQTAAMLIIAKASNPDLLMDVDLEEALQMLMEEATGMLPAGIYYFQGGTP